MFVDETINGSMVIIPIRVNDDGIYNNIDIEINKMSSAHGRENAISLLKDAFETEIEGKTPGIYYLNRKKAEFLRANGVQYPSAAKANSGLIRKITDNPDFVNQDEIKKRNTIKVQNEIHHSMAETKQERLEEELAEVTGSEGYDSMKQLKSHTAQECVNDFLEAESEGIDTVRALFDQAMEKRKDHSAKLAELASVMVFCCELAAAENREWIANLYVRLFAEAHACAMEHLDEVSVRRYENQFLEYYSLLVEDY